MASNLEYAVLARNSYEVSGPNDIRLPGWDPVDGLGGSGWGGFAAAVVQKGDEIVISFRGTDGESFDWDMIVGDSVPAHLIICRPVSGPINRRRR